MRRALLAEFSHAETLLTATRSASRNNHAPIDAFSPYPIDGIAELLGVGTTRLRVNMFIGGIAIAAILYFVEWWSAVVNYPINSGGRPLHSWLAFMLVPFATGIFAAALSGLITLFFTTGLPRLHHPLFAIDGFERVTQDRFVLAIARPENDDDVNAARNWLLEAGATRVWESQT